MTIYLATDHAGLELKDQVRDWLQTEGLQVEDCGAYEYDALDDFPDFIKVAAAAVAEAPSERKAVIFGGSGQGEAMMANRYDGVRAVVYYGAVPEIPALSREHNNSNVLSLGARFVSFEDAKQAVSDWLNTEALTDEKYHRRNQKLDTK